MPLSGKQKRVLRSLGHHLKPSLTIGKQGLAETVIRQLEDNLLATELVKVKALQSCPLEVDQLGAELEGRTGAQIAQKIGRTLLLYRPHPEAAIIDLPD